MPGLSNTYEISTRVRHGSHVTSRLDIPSVSNAAPPEPGRCPAGPARSGKRRAHEHPPRPPVRGRRLATARCPRHRSHRLLPPPRPPAETETAGGAANEMNLCRDGDLEPVGERTMTAADTSCVPV